MEIHGSWQASQAEALAAALARTACAPYPVDRVFPGAAIYSKHEVGALRALQRAVHAGVVALVEARLDLPAARRRLSMEPAVEEILRALHGRPYAAGTLRPDVIYDRDDAFRICEINARFPTNGYLMTEVLDEMAGLAAQWVPARPIERAPSIGSWFTADETIIVHGRETGWDIHLVARRHVGHQRCRIESVAGLVAGSHALSIGGVPLDRPGVRVCLELHQDELVGLGREALLALHAAAPHFNDLRTILVAHDKRALSVLCDPEVMRPLVGEAQAALLARHVVPTYVVGDRPDVCAAALRDRGEWVLKPNRLGKGAGMAFGALCSAEAWRVMLADPARRTHVLQPRVESQSFELVAPDGRTERVGVVGISLGMDHHALGPGMARASTGHVINVSGGGWMLMPMEALNV